MKKHNHALIKLCFFIIITIMCFPLHAEQQMTEGDKFVGIWQYPDEYISDNMNYLKIIKVGVGKYRLVEGFKDVKNLGPNIRWLDKRNNDINNDIYLRLSRGKLKGEFVSINFRPTHANEFKYKITIELKSNNKLFYSVLTMGGEEKHEATRVESSSTSNQQLDLNSDKPLSIGVLKNSVIDDCGCLFHQLSSNKNTDADQYIFVVGYSGQARININSQDIELRENGRKKGESGRCARNSCTYSGSGITATARYRQISRCPPEPTECEVNDYDATITVEKGGYRQIVKGKGQCGC